MSSLYLSAVDPLVRAPGSNQHTRSLKQEALLGIGDRSAKPRVLFAVIDGGCWTCGGDGDGDWLGGESDCFRWFVRVWLDAVF